MGDIELIRSVIVDRTEAGVSLAVERITVLGLALASRRAEADADSEMPSSELPSVSLGYGSILFNSWCESALFVSSGTSWIV